MRLQLIFRVAQNSISFRWFDPMACCLIAAFLFAQCMAMLRRWGVFWGVLPVPEGDFADTVFTRTLAFFRRPRVRMAVTALVAVELFAVGVWVKTEHGTHIAELADMGWSGLNGEHVVYAGVCSIDGDERVRIVRNDDRSALMRLN